MRLVRKRQQQAVEPLMPSIPAVQQSPRSATHLQAEDAVQLGGRRGVRLPNLMGADVGRAESMQMDWLKSRP